MPAEDLMALELELSRSRTLCSMANIKCVLEALSERVQQSRIPTLAFCLNL